MADAHGNRGKCAQPCRLPYELQKVTKSQGYDQNQKHTQISEKEKITTLDKGYLLSPRDLCGLDYIQDLIKAGVCSFKIEGRMKNPEYVATVTKIYSEALSKIGVSLNSKKALMQVFNRGGFSSGHLEVDANRDLVFKDKPNNMGLYLGRVTKFNKNKGYISLKPSEDISVGDTVSLENESGKYTVSELVDNSGNNISSAHAGQLITIGRMKGDISLGDKIFKMSSKELSNLAKASYSGENKKNRLNCKLTVKQGEPISMRVYSSANNHEEINITVTSDTIPVRAEKSPTTKERIINQISKTNNTPYEFENILVELEDNTFIPGVSCLNKLRRDALEKVENIVIKKSKRVLEDDFSTKSTNANTNIDVNMNSIMDRNINTKITTKKISVLLNILHEDYDYSKLTNIDNIYIPLKYWLNKKYDKILKTLSKKFNVYIYMPTIIKGNYRNLFLNNIDFTLEKYDIKGFVSSNIGVFELLKNYIGKYDFIGNYTLNIFNLMTINELKSLGCSTVTLSPELSKTNLQHLASSSPINTEGIVYGYIPVMNSNYCLIGKTNKCYPTCKKGCMENSSKYFIKDRLGLNFRIIPDNIQTVTTIYNSKILSISHKDINFNSVRIDILDESIDEINKIVHVVKSGDKLEGKEFTNGNLSREV